MDKNINDFLVSPESEENSDKSGLLEKSEEEFLDEEDDDGFIYEVKKQKSKRKSDIEM